MTNDTTIPAAPIAIDATMTVNDVVAAAPATVAVFNAWNIDACCGGAKTLATVAERHGFDLARLLAELNAATGRS